MGRRINIRGIALYANTAPCAHECSFCLLGRKSVAHVPYSRIARLVKRFLDWKEHSQQADFTVYHWIRYSYNFSIEDMQEFVAILQLQGRVPDIMAGGLPFMPDTELHRWIQDRQQLGIEEMHLSFLGTQHLHDQLCQREGDYQYRLQILELAAKLGMRLNIRSLLTQETIVELPELLKRLAEIPACKVTWCISPLFYMGLAEALEKQRIGEEDRAHLLATLPSSHIERIAQWRSEREWRKEILSKDDEIDQVMLRLDPDEKTIDRLEALSCEEILKDLEQRTREAYAAMPGLRQLCETVSDPRSTRIYALPNDIERLWIDRYLQRFHCSFNRELTHLSMVQ